MWGIVVQQRACHMVCHPPDREDNKAGPPKESCSRDRDTTERMRERKITFGNLNYQMHWLWKGLENICIQRPTYFLKINFAPWKVKSTNIQNVFFSSTRSFSRNSSLHLKVRRWGCSQHLASGLKNLFQVIKTL